MLLLDGLELLELGLALEPDAALPDALPELAPPLAWSFLLSIELEGAVLGEDGEVVEPADDDVEPDGEVVAPREAARSPVLSHAATRAVPSATETASARVVNLI